MFAQQILGIIILIGLVETDFIGFLNYSSLRLLQPTDEEGCCNQNILKGKVRKLVKKLPAGDPLLDGSMLFSA